MVGVWMGALIGLLVAEWVSRKENSSQLVMFNIAFSQCLIKLKSKGNILCVSFWSVNFKVFIGFTVLFYSHQIMINVVD